MGESTNKSITINCDGACLPSNPGGYACWAYHANDDSGKCIGQDYGTLGKNPSHTNFIAEYSAVVEALKRVKREGWINCTVRTDSKIVTEQINGFAACNAAHLRPYLKQAAQLAKEMHAQVVWIPREQNSRADRLCDIAYNKALLEEPITS